MMHVRSTRADGAARLAFTLVEVMLVLAVVGVLAAVAWPSVVRMQADHTLSAAAEQTRMVLAEARKQAIHSGLAYQFRFEPKGRRFCAVLFEAEPVTQANAMAGASNPPMMIRRFSGELPATISFLPANSAATTGITAMGQKLPEAAFQGLPDAAQLASTDWSAPLVFLSEGSSQDTVLTLADRRGHRIDIEIRGITAAATVGMMRREAVR